MRLVVVLNLLLVLYTQLKIKLRMKELALHWKRLKPLVLVFGDPS
jgi:hypothetical protein